ncbi:MAG: DUF2442 domain-containing protein [Victivallales bacterium]
MNGTSVKKNAEVKMVTSAGLCLVVEDKEYFAAFADFPYLAALPSTQIFNVEYCGHGHIRWDDADIDLHTKILSHPKAYPLRMQSVTFAAAQMSRRGGSVRSSRKAVSNHTKGLKGGRSPKRRELVLA